MLSKFSACIHRTNEQAASSDETLERRTTSVAFNNI